MTNQVTIFPAHLVQDFAEVEPKLHQAIAHKIPLDGLSHSYPEYFSEFVRSRLKRAPGKSLVLPANTEINGDLALDNGAAWNSNHDITAIIVEGDLSIHGNLLNTDLNDGPMLFVAGTLKTHNVIKGGAYILVLGHLQARGIIVGEYNDGVIRVGGQIKAQATLSIDHDIYVRESMEGAYYDFDETVWEDVLVPEVLEDGMPTGVLILDRLNEGRSIFLE